MGISRRGFKACLLFRSILGGGGSNKRLWKPSLGVGVLALPELGEPEELVELAAADLLALLAFSAADALLAGTEVAGALFLGNGRPLLTAGAFLTGLAGLAGAFLAGLAGLAGAFFANFLAGALAGFFADLLALLEAFFAGAMAEKGSPFFLKFRTLSQSESAKLPPILRVRHDLEATAPGSRPSPREQNGRKALHEKSRA